VANNVTLSDHSRDSRGRGEGEPTAEERREGEGGGSVLGEVIVKAGEEERSLREDALEFVLHLTSDLTIPTEI
jgi:hypothetical protein